MSAVPVQAQDLSLYAEPPDGWTYSYNGDAAASEEEASLDGTWSQNNGSDAWDSSVIGEGAPGGASALDDGGEAFLRMQDSGDPRDFDIADPSNRKVSFYRDLGFEGANADNGGNFSEEFKPLRDGVTLNFRARLPTPSTGGPLDQIHSGDMKDVPDVGDGGTIHDSGKGMFGIHEADTEDPDADKSGKISFSLGLTTDEQNGSPEMDGLIMNSKSGPDVSGDVEAGEGIEQNLVPVENLTEWHEFWITVIRDDSDEEATHKVLVYKDGSIEPETFFVTAGTGQDNDSDYLWLSLGATPQSAAVDIDFYRVAAGVVEPSLPSDPNIAISRASGLGQVATVPAAHSGLINVRNTGESKVLTLSNFTLAGSSPDNWTLDAMPSTIAVGQADQINYTFNSLGQTGAFTATLTFETDDPDSPTVTINLSASVINTTGPGGHYSLDDNANAEDPVIVDITGYDRPGNYVPGEGTVTFGQNALATGTAAAVGGGGSFTIPARGFGDITNYSATFWVNLSELPGELGALVSRAGANDSNPAVSLLVTADGALTWLVPDAPVDPFIFTTETKLSIGTPYHLAIVAEGNHDKVSVYLNGELIGSGEALGEANPDETGLFFFGSYGPLFTTGTYDDLQIYTRALPASDIAFLAANPGGVLKAEEPDSDGDGLTDAEEVALMTDPVKPDTDGDGLSDFEELREYSTNPLLVDSDGDGREDGAEIAAGFDPNDPRSPAPAATGSLLQNIVAHWPLDETDGSEAADAIGVHVGAVMGTAEWKPGEGKVGGAIFFDGSDGFIEVADAPEFRFAEEESWAASLWYKADEIEDDQGLITKGYHDDSRATTGYWMMQTRAGGFTLDSRCCEGGNPRARIDSDSDISHGDGEWHHFVVTRDGALSEIRLYVDGQLTARDVSGEDQGLWAMGDNEDPLVIANHFNRFTVGWFDDIAIWKGYALTDADVAAIAAEGVGAALDAGPGGGGPPVELTLVEGGLEGDDPGIVESAAYGEDALTFSDRTHEHNGAAFDSISGELTVEGDLTVDLPNYLVGQSYVRFANNARDNADFVATVTASGPTHWYLLIDNRLDGPNAARKDNASDPILGGTLQWIIDAGWERVNTGISPNGQPDFVGVDESGDGGLNQFYSVYTLAEPSTTVTINGNGIGGTNMLALVGSGAVGDGGGNPDPGLLPPLENVGDNADGIFGFTIPNNLAVDIEYSTDLLRWETIAADVSGTLEETDPDRSNAPSGYYRAIQR